jgi:hypothetical protein
MSHSISNLAFKSIFVLATKNKSNTTSNTINKIQNAAPYKQTIIKAGSIDCKIFLETFASVRFKKIAYRITEANTPIIVTQFDFIISMAPIFVLDCFGSFYSNLLLNIFVALLMPWMYRWIIWRVILKKLPLTSKP